MCASCVPELRFESGLLLTGESALSLDIPDRNSHMDRRATPMTRVDM